MWSLTSDPRLPPHGARVAFYKEAGRRSLTKSAGPNATIQKRTGETYEQLRPIWAFAFTREISLFVLLRVCQSMSEKIKGRTLKNDSFRRAFYTAQSPSKLIYLTRSCIEHCFNVSSLLVVKLANLSPFSVLTHPILSLKTGLTGKADKQVSAQSPRLCLSNHPEGGLNEFVRGYQRNEFQSQESNIPVSVMRLQIDGPTNFCMASGIRLLMRIVRFRAAYLSSKIRTN